tara:strand:+ start:323 stop:703 length:381 start_codon:yes stop_codon:yes gene_type:complete
MTEKNDNAYKSIGEVAKILKLVNQKNGKLNTHTIRFWEKEFKIIKPKFFSGNRRYYDNKSIYMLKKIKDLLKEDGMTIQGVKKYLANSNSFKLDESNLNTIKGSKSIIKNKVEKISTIIKQIKELG